MVDPNSFKTSKEIYEYYYSVTPKKATKHFVAALTICILSIILLIVSAILMSIYQNHIDSTDVLHCPYDLYMSYIRSHLAFEILLILSVPMVIASSVAIFVTTSTINNNRKKAALSKMPPEIKDRYDKLREDEEEAERNKSIEKTRKWLAENKDKIVSKTYILSSRQKSNFSEKVRNGLIGGALFGEIGAFAGIAGTKEKFFTTFLIIYEDGHSETREVENSSALYNIYLEHLSI